MIKVFYSDMALDEVDERAIFLAGPTPRRAGVPSWRPEAIRLLDTLGYDGTVLVPERRNWVEGFDYLDQVLWEDTALSIASVIVFWVPRRFPDMPALTTNVEFGRWITLRPSAVVYGRPDDAEKCRYLDWLYEKELDQKPHATLVATLQKALEIV